MPPRPRTGPPRSEWAGVAGARGLGKYAHKGAAMTGGGVGKRMDDETMRASVIIGGVMTLRGMQREPSWSADDDREVLAGVARGETHSCVAARLGRTAEAVTRRLYRLRQRYRDGDPVVDVVGSIENLLEDGWNRKERRELVAMLCRANRPGGPKGGLWDELREPWMMLQVLKGEERPPRGRVARKVKRGGRR